MSVFTMPCTEKELTAMKPSQAELDTAERVLWWLVGHAQLFPAEYGEEMGISQRPVHVLAAAAQACHVWADHLETTAAGIAARDAENAHVLNQDVTYRPVNEAACT